MQVIVNDLVVSYSRSGEGPITVLLHGWADSANTFSKLLPLLEPYFTVVSIDLAGFGGSQAPKKAWGLNNYAEHVRDILQKISIMPNDITVLLGHSNGGAIAITAIANNYIRPKKLVLLASAGVRTGKTSKKIALIAAAKAGKIATLILPKRQRAKLRKKFYGAVGSDLLVAEHMQESFKKIVKQDVLHLAERLHLPTLLVYGELDTATPVTYGQILQNTIAGSELRVVQNADHFLHQNHADQVAAYIRSFMGL